MPTEIYLLLAPEGQKRTGGLLLGILNKGNLNTSPFCLWYSPSDTTAPATGLISPTQLVAIAERYWDIKLIVATLPPCEHRHLYPLTLLLKITV